MSVEVHVFFRGKLPAKASLVGSLRDWGFPLTFSPGTGPLDKHEGFVPMRFGGEETGFEFEVISDPADLQEYRQDEIDPALDRCAVFRLGDMIDLFAAQSVAAALAKLTGGTVYDPEEGRVQPLDDAIAAARSTFDIVMSSRRKRPRGTRPADIRHYLKPLLKERPDLVLRGRHLFIRPVRHVLRGAGLWRESPYGLEISIHFKRLYLPRDLGSSFATARRVDVWQPYFEPWLLDVLQHDVFDLAGQIAGISDLADFDHRRGPGTRHYCVLDYLLSGERDRAEALVQEYERTLAPSVGARERALFERNIDDLCAECHRQEAETAKALELGDMWQPTPFPVEVPHSVRRQQTDEPPFVSTPWAAMREPVTAAPPAVPDEVAFARSWTTRKGSVVPVAPLTRDQAQAMHDNDESYCLIVPLSGGDWLILDRNSGWSPHDPDSPRRPSNRNWDQYRMRILGPERYLYAHFWQSGAAPGTVRLWSIHASDTHANSRWDALVDYARGLIRTHGLWKGEAAPDEQPLARSDGALWQLALPRLGEYEEFLARTNAFLEHIGYGRFTA